MAGGSTLELAAAVSPSTGRTAGFWTPFSLLPALTAADSLLLLPFSSPTTGPLLSDVPCDLSGVRLVVGLRRTESDEREADGEADEWIDELDEDEGEDGAGDDELHELFDCSCC